MLLCFSVGFSVFAGPGEEYRRKLEEKKIAEEDNKKPSYEAIEFDDKLPESQSDEKEERIGKALFASRVGQRESQVILVLDHQLSLWNKGEDRYFKLKEWKNGYGRKGMKKAEERKEGDETSPIGAFPISFAFGFKEKENTLLPYRQIKKNSVWSGEKSTYNQWVEKEVPGTIRYAMKKRLQSVSIKILLCTGGGPPFSYISKPPVLGRVRGALQ